MRKLLLLFGYLLVFGPCKAHPGIGIVKDSHGNIYYTDLKQVWKITAEGNKKIAVAGVHTHELYIDARDNLYGEHLWNNGERLNTWGHYVWCLKHDGTLVKDIEPTEGFLSNYSFCRDIAGNMYWVERFTTSRFIKKAPGGQVSTIAEGNFKDVRWMHATPQGVVYFIDLEKLYRIKDTQVKLLADKLNETTVAFRAVGERHNAYGIWTDKIDNIYVALHRGQRVKKITPDGNVSTLVNSTSPWSPASGVFDDEGNLWLLEYTLTADCRVRKINKSRYG